MFKRLFGGTDFQKTFQQAKIDKSHDAIQFKELTTICLKYLSSKQQQKKQVNININISNNRNNQISININNNSGKTSIKTQNQLKKKQLIKLLLKKIKNSNDIIRIKGLIVAHYFIRKTYNEEFMDIIADHIDQYIVTGLTLEEKEERRYSSRSKDGSKLKSGINLENTKDQFVNRNVISFYCQYLKKFIINVDTFKFAEDLMNSRKTYQEKDGNFIDLINKGFIILNLVNYILQSQNTFNQMGRYYVNHYEYINLFMMYLSDLTVYNYFIKEISKTSLKNIKNIKQQDIKHHFIFISEAQKTSDRLYEFFFNRYYYSKIKKIIFMPTFLIIHNHQYKQLVNHVKKYDKSLVALVQNSKYQGRDRSKSLATLQDSLQKTMFQGNKTEIVDKDFNNLLALIQFQDKSIQVQKAQHSLIQNPKEVQIKKIKIKQNIYQKDDFGGKIQKSKYQNQKK